VGDNDQRDIKPTRQLFNPECCALEGGVVIEIRETATEIRRLRPEDAALYREIRLEALQRNPEAFSGTFEVEAAQTQAFFADRLAASAVFGAFRLGDLLGIAGFYIQQGREEAQRKHIRACWSACMSGLLPDEPGSPAGWSTPSSPTPASTSRRSN
jgi:hypothetical protein